jgi:hypothetical protein
MLLLDINALIIFSIAPDRRGIYLNLKETIIAWTAGSTKASSQASFTFTVITNTGTASNSMADMTQKEKV